MNFEEIESDIINHLSNSHFHYISDPEVLWVYDDRISLKLMLLNGWLMVLSNGEIVGTYHVNVNSIRDLFSYDLNRFCYHYDFDSPRDEWYEDVALRNFYDIVDDDVIDNIGLYEDVIRRRAIRVLTAICSMTIEEASSVFSNGPVAFINKYFNNMSSFYMEYDEFPLSFDDFVDDMYGEYMKRFDYDILCDDEKTEFRTAWADNFGMPLCDIELAVRIGKSDVLKSLGPEFASVGLRYGVDCLWHYHTIMTYAEKYDVIHPS